MIWKCPSLRAEDNADEKGDESVTMRKMTKANLEAAFAGESQAHMKYAVFAEKAKAEEA